MPCASILDVNPHYLISACRWPSSSIRQRQPEVILSLLQQATVELLRRMQRRNCDACRPQRRIMRQMRKLEQPRHSEVGARLMMRLVQTAVETMVMSTMLRLSGTAAACRICTITTDATSCTPFAAMPIVPGFTDPLLYSYFERLRICPAAATAACRWAHFCSRTRIELRLHCEPDCKAQWVLPCPLE